MTAETDSMEVERRPEVEGQVRSGVGSSSHWVCDWDGWKNGWVWMFVHHQRGLVLVQKLYPSQFPPLFQAVKGMFARCSCSLAASLNLKLSRPIKHQPVRVRWQIGMLQWGSHPSSSLSGLSCWIWRCCNDASYVLSEKMILTFTCRYLINYVSGCSSLTRPR